MAQKIYQGLLGHPPYMKLFLSLDLDIDGSKEADDEIRSFLKNPALLSRTKAGSRTISAELALTEKFPVHIMCFVWNFY